MSFKLNWQESTTILKEPLGIVYTENYTQSLVAANVSDASANDSARKTRQLTQGFSLYSLLVFISYSLNTDYIASKIPYF